MGAVLINSDDDDELMILELPKYKIHRLKKMIDRDEFKEELHKRVKIFVAMFVLSVSAWSAFYDGVTHFFNLIVKKLIGET